MNGKRNQTSPIGSPLSENISDNSSKDHDKLLPIANVSRLMKKSLPSNAKISKEAKETVQECVSEFISFITGEASDKCQREKRKTINGDDLLWAMTTLGFENYVRPLKFYLNKYRETEGEKISNINHVVHEVNNSISTKVDFQSFNPGFNYTVGTGQVSSKVYDHEESGRVLDFGDHNFLTSNGTYNMNRLQEINGDGHTNRAMTSTNFHHGSIGW